MKARANLSQQRQTQGGNLVLAIFALIGTIFVAAGLLIGLHQQRVFTQWPRAEATVTSSRLSLASPWTYSAEIEVAYSVAGKPYLTLISPGSASDDQAAMQELVTRYAPGSRHQLPYDPEHPESMSIETGWTTETALLPLIFGLMGLIFLLIGIVPLVWARLPRPAPRPRDYAAPGDERWVSWIGAGFTALGLIFLGVCVWGGVARARQAQWPETQAEILASRPFSYSRGKSGTYHAAELQLRYHVQGQTYSALSVGDSISRDADWVRQAVAGSHAPGQRIALRYNPERPAEIRFGESDFTWFWILLLLGTVFTGMGVLVLVVFRPGKA